MKSFSQFIREQDLQESGPNEPKFYTSSTEDKFQGSKEGKKLRNIKKKSTPSITRGSGVGPTERINPDDIKTQQTQNKIAKQRVKSAQKSGNIADFSNKPIEGAPDTKTIVRGTKGETIANPVNPTSKTTAEKTIRVSTAGTGGKEVTNQTKFSTDTTLQDTKTKKPSVNTKPPVNTKPAVTTTQGKTVIGTTPTGRIKTTYKTSSTQIPDKSKRTKNTTRVKKNQQLTVGDLEKNKPSQTSKVTSDSGRKIEKQLKSTTSKSKLNISKQIKPNTPLSSRPTTVFTEPVKDLKSFVKKSQQVAGIAPLEPKTRKIDKKLVKKSPSATKTALKKVPFKLKLARGIQTAGRFASGAYAVKDYLDTVAREKAKGRSVTSARIGGLSRALGGYIGGGLGASVGGTATAKVGGIGSIPGGIAGYKYGSDLGTKLYDTGRKIVAGKKTFKQLRKDINKGAKNVYKGTKNFFDTSGNP